MLPYFAISWCAAMRWREPYKANIIPLSWTNLMAWTSKQTKNFPLPHGSLTHTKLGEMNRKTWQKTIAGFCKSLRRSISFWSTQTYLTESHSVSKYINQWKGGHIPAARLAQKPNWWIGKWQFLQVSLLSCSPRARIQALRKFTHLWQLFNVMLLCVAQSLKYFLPLYNWWPCQIVENVSDVLQQDS